MIRDPMRFADTPIEHRAPPLPGADIRDVLTGLLGKTGAECDVLAAKSVI